MSNVIASQRSFAASKRRRPQPTRRIPDTDYLDLDYDDRNRALWTYLTERAPAYASLEVIQDMLSVDNVCATTLAVSRSADMPIDYKIMASKRAGVFSLGGDLASFRYHIDQNDRNALTQYAHAALDAIWTNTQGAGVDGMTTVSLVQGEAQGGGFEAALSAHVLVAEKGAMFGFPEALFGMFPGMGGFALLEARTNSDCAKRLIGSTNRYSAEMLYEMGVVDLLAEKGKGKQFLDRWMSEATAESTLKYRTRFAELDRTQLVDSVDEWVEQAMCLNRRQLRTMGYILEAQKRASKKPSTANVTQLRRMIEFDDLCSEELIDTESDAIPSPLLITPKTVKRFNEIEFLSFVKRSRPWVYENLSKHGAVLFRGFAGTGADSLSRLSAALRSDRLFNAVRSVPTPAKLEENVFQDDCWLTETPQALHNAYSDCAVFPLYKILACDQRAPSPGGSVTLASTRSIYQHLSEELVLEFEKRGITYRRQYPDIATISQESERGSIQVNAWQHIFKTQDRRDAENKCRENGLSFQWGADGGLEVWNSAPACISHAETSDRLWFNQVHLFKSSSINFLQPKSLLSKLFSIVRSPLSMDATFCDGTAIPQTYVDEIAAVHQDLTVEVELEVGDFLLVDNTMCAQGRHALGKNQRLLMTTY